MAMTFAAENAIAAWPSDRERPIGRRPKANDPRWLPAKVNRPAGVCWAIESGTRDADWDPN